MYLAVLSEAKAKVFVDQIFAKFDTDNSGEIDFKVSFTVSSYHWSPAEPEYIILRQFCHVFHPSFLMRKFPNCK